MNALVTRRAIAQRALFAPALIAAWIPAIAAARAESLPAAAVAALYETRIIPKRAGAKPVTTRWYFWREADRVEVRDELGHSGERWERDPSGRLFYARLFHEHRAQIEFAPTEFQTMGKSWDRISMLIEPGWLGSPSKPAGSERRAGQPLTRYRGSADGRRIDLLWRADLALPAEIRGDDARASTTLRLLRSWPLAQAPRAMTDAATLAAYRSIDGADLGDLESDPFVMSLVNPGGPPHGH